jgi:hypothetical protein
MPCFAASACNPAEKQLDALIQGEEASSIHSSLLQHMMLLSTVCTCNALCAGGWKPAGHQLDALPELMRVQEKSSLLMLLSYLQCSLCRCLETCRRAAGWFA